MTTFVEPPALYKCSVEQTHFLFNTDQGKCKHDNCKGIILRLCHCCNQWIKYKKYGEHKKEKHQNIIFIKPKKSAQQNISSTIGSSSQDFSQSSQTNCSISSNISTSNTLTFNNFSLLTPQESTIDENIVPKRSNEFTVAITTGWPIIKYFLITNIYPKCKIEDMSETNKRSAIKSIINFIKESNLFESFVKEIMIDDDFKPIIDGLIEKNCELARKEGASLQMQELNDCKEKCALLERGLYISKRSNDIQRLCMELEPIEDTIERNESRIKKYQKPPKYFNENIKNFIVKEIEDNFSQFESSKTKLSKLLSTKIVDKFQDGEANAAAKTLKSSMGGYYLHYIYCEVKEIDFDSSFKRKLRRAYNKSTLGTNFHSLTEKYKTEVVEEHCLYGIDFTDEQIKNISQSDIYYIGEVTGSEENEVPIILRDVRLLLIDIILLIHELDGFQTTMGNITVETIHWGDGCKLLANGLIVCCISIINDPKIFKQTPLIKNILNTWIPYLLFFVNETKEGVQNAFFKRKGQFQRLEENYQITEDFTISFKLKLYVADLSFLWKMFNLNNGVCAHCLKELVGGIFSLQDKLVERRKLGNTSSEIFSKFEVECNTSTICDILHSIKGFLTSLEDLLININGIKIDIIEDLKRSILHRNDISLLSGGNIRLFYLQYNSWIDEIVPIMKSNLKKSKRNESIISRFEFCLDNLKWILFCISEISKYVYRSQNTKEHYEYIYLETLSTLLFISLKSRYGTEFMNNYSHAITIHLPQDFKLINQRFSSCERGEFFLSVLKRVALTESNRTKENSLQIMILSFVAHFERIKKGDKDKDYEKMKTIFKNIKIESCNFKFKKSLIKGCEELDWFITNYLPSIEGEKYLSLDDSEIYLVFNEEWKYSEFSLDQLIINHKNLPSIPKPKKEKPQVKCVDCGCNSNVKCTSCDTPKCRLCCALSKFLKKSNNTCAVKSHDLSAEDFLKTYGYKVGEGQSIIAATKKRRNKQKKLNDIKEASKVAKDSIENGFEKKRSNSKQKGNRKKKSK